MLKKLMLVVGLSAAAIGGVAAAQGLGGDAGPMKQKLLEKYDVNHNGVLDPSEKATMRADWKAKREARKAEMLAKYDLNKDGKLEDNEKAIMRDDRAEAAFKKMDADGNGQISIDEFKAARTRFARHHRGGLRGKRQWGRGRGQGGAGPAPQGPASE